MKHIRQNRSISLSDLPRDVSSAVIGRAKTSTNQKAGIQVSRDLLHFLSEHPWKKDSHSLENERKKILTSSTST